MITVLWCTNKVGFCKFSTKIYIFKVPVIFENENFAARVTRAHGRSCWFFGNELLKINLIGSILSLFENLAKKPYHSTLECPAAASLLSALTLASAIILYSCDNATMRQHTYYVLKLLWPAKKGTIFAPLSLNVVKRRATICWP